MSVRLTLIIGNKNYSSWSMRPWLVLRYFDLDFDEVRLPLDTPGFAGQIAGYSKAGKVPVLVHRAVSVWDSLAICEYLAELFPNQGLWPRPQEYRATARAVAAEMHSSFSSLRRELPMNCRATGRQLELSEPTIRAVRRVEEIWTECRAGNPSGGPFLFGPFCIADAMYAPVVSRFETYGVDVREEARRYMQSIGELPCFQQWTREALAESETLPCDEIGI